MARGSVDVRHKSRAYLCVQGSSIAHVFPVFLIIPCIPTTYLFPDFTCSRPLLVFVMAKQVKHFTHSRREENLGMRSKLPMIGTARPPSNRPCSSSLVLTRKDHCVSLKNLIEMCPKRKTKVEINS